MTMLSQIWMRVRRKTILVHKHDFEDGFHDVVSSNMEASSNVKKLCKYIIS